MQSRLRRVRRKIDYTPDEILNQRLSFEQCMAAIDECGAPVVSIAHGEPAATAACARIVGDFYEAQEVRDPVLATPCC